MVFPGEGDYMATGHERPKTRHDFTLPNLKWGIQRNLRCTKVDSDDGSVSVDQRIRRRPPPSEFDGGATPFRFGGGVDNRNQRSVTGRWRSEENSGEEGIEEYGEKIMSELRTAADKMKESIFRERIVDYEEEEEKRNDKERRKEELEPRKKEREVSPPEAPGVAVEVKPWNLRKRRAACKAPITESGNCDANQYNYKGLGIYEEKRVNPSANSMRPKFMSTLSKKEIEDDYMRMMGHRPPRRPKKRLRTVQKQIDLLHPAFYFTEITEDIYKVPDAAEKGKMTMMDDKFQLKFSQPYFADLWNLLKLECDQIRMLKPKML